MSVNRVICKLAVRSVVAEALTKRATIHRAVLISSADNLLELFTPYQIPVNVSVPTFSLQAWCVERILRLQGVEAHLPALTIERPRHHPGQWQCIGCPSVDISIGPLFLASALMEAPALQINLGGGVQCRAETNALSARALSIAGNESQTIEAAPFWKTCSPPSPGGLDKESCKKCMGSLTSIARQHHRNAWQTSVILAFGVVHDDCLPGFHELEQAVQSVHDDIAVVVSSGSTTSVTPQRRPFRRLLPVDSSTKSPTILTISSSCPVNEMLSRRNNLTIEGGLASTLLSIRGPATHLELYWRLKGQTQVESTRVLAALASNAANVEIPVETSVPVLFVDAISSCKHLGTCLRCNSNRWFLNMPTSRVRGSAVLVIMEFAACIRPLSAIINQVSEAGMAEMGSPLFQKVLAL